MTTGIEAIANERKRQIEVKGFDAEHDYSELPEDLMAAAYCYVNAARWSSVGRPEKCLKVSIAWPWGNESWKPSNNTRRNLIKAGALIAAAIDRLNDAE